MSARATERRGAWGVLLGLALVASVVGAIGACQGGGGRFPTCNNDADCKKRDTGKDLGICVELRCVECRSDDDCQSGHACNVANECRPFTDTAPAPDGGKKEVIEKETWEQSTPEDREKCLEACKGQPKECKDRCGGAAPKKAPPKK